MTHWLTASQIVASALPGLPHDKGGLSRLIARENWRETPFAREGQSGWEYHANLLPSEARAALAVAPAIASPVCRPDQAAAWASFEALSDKAKNEARRRLAIMEQVAALREGGMKAGDAVAMVAMRAGVSTSTIWGWSRLVDTVARPDWLAALAPHHKGRTVTADCDPRAWDMIAADYLRPERPSFAACHRRMLEAAALHGWSPIPASKTLQRRLEKLPRPVTVLARHGVDALARIYPHQTRDRSAFSAMQAVNADGHQFDVFCRFEDGTIGRPVMVGVQDLASGMLLGWRMAQTESWTSVRLAFADMVVRFGIPQEAWLDNGRAFASKWLTGGMKTRYRFTIRDDEPAGILTQLGVKVHWTTPYHGQSKPIERAWRDLCEEIAKHPECAGAYTGNSVTAKPENYGSRAIPIEQFRALVHREILRHNARPGRTGGNCRGRSFAETFAESYQRDGMATAASPAQSRLLLMAADGVTCRKPTGEIELGGNRYWDEALVGHMGRQVVVRFDPDDLHAPIAVYSRDGRMICEAACIEAAGFADAAAAQQHARTRRGWIKAQKDMLALENRLGIAGVAQLLPQPAATPASAATPKPISPPRGADNKTQEADTAEASFGRAMRAFAGE
jgi:putative transposase